MSVGSEKFQAQVVEYGVREVGRLLGVSPSMVSRWATGKALPDGGNLCHVENVFDIDAGEWFEPTAPVAPAEPE